MRKRVLVTGATGMLGAEVTNHMHGDGEYEVFGIARKERVTNYENFTVDLSDIKSVEQILQKINPDYILHCAANVNLDDCELNKEAAYQLHVQSSKALASYNPGNCKIIYISTDSVFDGYRGGYKEADIPAPLNYYAGTKLQGEYETMMANPNSLALRTNMYGLHKFGNHNSLFEWIYDNLSNNKTIRGFNDVYFNPLYTGQLSHLIAKLLEIDAKGILHAGCNQIVSKYEFALAIAEVFHFEKSLILESSSDSVSSAVMRPKNTSLNTDKIKSLTQLSFDLKIGLEALKNKIDNKIFI